MQSTIPHHGLGRTETGLRTLATAQLTPQEQAASLPRAIDRESRVRLYIPGSLRLVVRSFFAAVEAGRR